MSELTHVDEEGRVAMVDTTGKARTARRAVASARVLMSAETVAALRAMQGALAAAPFEETAALSRPARGAAERASYLPAALSTDGEGRLLAEPLKWGGSSDFVAFARAEALVIVAAGVREVEAGSVVQVVRLPV